MDVPFAVGLQGGILKAGDTINGDFDVFGALRQRQAGRNDRQGRGEEDFLHGFISTC